MVYVYDEAYYEGSPELGYVSKLQIQEFVEREAAEADDAQLFSSRNPEKTAQFGTYVFNRMLFALGMYREGYYDDQEQGPITAYRGGDEIINGTNFELGLRDEELGVLVNLDHLDKVINGDGWTEYRNVELTGKTCEAVNAFITERKRFLGIAETRYETSAY